ncbi:MAG: tRNA pseudouridine(38-40) synthase TruA [Eubacteriales bacterium]
MKYLIKLKYCGTAYAGFQVQKNGNTIQAELMRTAEKIFTVPCLITGCSRTDSGVHANEYFATLETSCGASKISPEKLPLALCSALPQDIVVTAAKEVPQDFSVRRSVFGKEYVYLILEDRNADPFLVGRAWHYARELDIEKMNRAAGDIIGKHDFSSFMASGSDIKDTVRNVTRCAAVRDKDGLCRIYVAADGFLYNMVRIIVGTLVYVSEGKIPEDGIKSILLSGDRKNAGKTAPADGLYLNRVFIDF